MTSRWFNLDPDKMPAAWTGGQIAAAWVWDPTLTELLKNGHAVMSSADTAKAGKPTFDLEVARTKFIDANQPFMTIWAACQDAAVKLAKDDPDKAAESISAEIGVPPAVVKKQFAGYTFLTATEQASPDYLGGKLGKDLAATAQFLLQQGGIDAVGAPGTYAKAVDAAPAKSVK